MAYDKPTGGSFAAAVFGGLAQGLSMVAQNKIATRREDELYAKEKADRDAAIADTRDYNAGLLADEREREDLKLKTALALRKKEWGRDYMLDKMGARDTAKATADAKTLAHERRLEEIGVMNAFKSSARPVDPTKELNAKMGLVGSIFGGMKHDVPFIRDVAALMTEYPKMDVQKAANYVASDDVATTIGKTHLGVAAALKDSRSGWEDAKISTGDIEPVLLKHGMLPDREIPESDDWTPKDVAMLVAGLYDNPTKIKTDFDTQAKIADMVEEIINSTYVMAPPDKPLSKAIGGYRHVRRMDTPATAASPRPFAPTPELADYKTLSEILNQGR